MSSNTTSNNTSKRIKHVVSDSQVAHLWANQSQSDARNARKNIYFEGDTIYSYGGHFPIATHVTGTRGRKAIMFTTRTYSNTTSKHIWITKGALRGDVGVPVFYVEDPRGGLSKPSKAMAEIWQQEYLALAITNLESACLKWVNSDSLIGLAQDSINVGNALASFFGSRKRIKLPTALLGKATVFCEKTAERRRKHGERVAYKRLHESEIRLAKRMAVEKKNAEEMKEQIVEWRTGSVDANNNYRLYSVPAMLRIKPGDGEVIQTSMGAEFPLSHGRRAYLFLGGLRAFGKTYQRNGHTAHVGQFVIDSMDSNGTVRAGCHTLSWDEIATFAIANGWPTVFSGPVGLIVTANNKG